MFHHGHMERKLAKIRRGFVYIGALVTVGRVIATLWRRYDTRGNLMEQVFYETRPYGFLGLALYALTHASQCSYSALMAASGVLLLMVSVVVLKARLKNRGQLGIKI